MATRTTIITIMTLAIALIVAEARSAEDPIQLSFDRMLEHQPAKTRKPESTDETNDESTDVDELTASINEVLWTKKQEEALLIAAKTGEDNDR